MFQHRRSDLVQCRPRALIALNVAQVSARSRVEKFNAILVIWVTSQPIPWRTWLVTSFRRLFDRDRRSRMEEPVAVILHLAHTVHHSSLAATKQLQEPALSSLCLQDVMTCCFRLEPGPKIEDNPLIFACSCGSESLGL